jgi:hypothetical protein
MTECNAKDPVARRAVIGEPAFEIVSLIDDHEVERRKAAVASSILPPAVRDGVVTQTCADEVRPTRPELSQNGLR